MVCRQGWNVCDPEGNQNNVSTGQRTTKEWKVEKKWGTDPHSLQRSQSWWHHIFELSASRILRLLISFVQATQFLVPCYSISEKNCMLKLPRTWDLERLAAESSANGLCREQEVNRQNGQWERATKDKGDLGLSQLIGLDYSKILGGHQA